MNNTDSFNYNVDRFDDIQVLRYKVEGFENLSLNQKKLIYYLSLAAMYGRDILFGQNCKYSLTIRKTLNAIYQEYKGDKTNPNFLKLEEYLKKVWFASGIHHHYGCDKFVPGFTQEFFENEVNGLADDIKIGEFKSKTDLLNTIIPVIFDATILPKRVNKKDGDDLLLTSACNYYEGVTQQEAIDFYNSMKKESDLTPLSYGLNTKLIKEFGELKEITCCTNGLYGDAIDMIVYFLETACQYAETNEQASAIKHLINYYNSGDLQEFDEYNKKWLKDTESLVDFVNGFIEVYGDPIAIKGSWESIVNFKDVEATKRTQIISSNAQWFEDNSPVDKHFKKEKVIGVIAKTINAAILGGDLYPATAIGINLPNANWIRSEYGSKSVTISNITDAYNKAAKGSPFRKEFVYSDKELELLEKYGDVTGQLHTDYHECLGHGSGKLFPNVTSSSLGSYHSAIEEARADLFALYYLPDKKTVELGLLPDNEAYKAEYYSFIMNGLISQLVRVKLGNNIEESHMVDRQLISRFVYEKGKNDKVIEFVKKNGKTYVVINDYEKLRELFGDLLKLVQEITSIGDIDTAKILVEVYGIKVDQTLHKEILERNEKLNVAPYKGFVNPKYTAIYDDNGEITDVEISYDESYVDQMLRYDEEYSTL